MSEAKTARKKADRPICGARRKSDGKPCQCTALMSNGRCRVHGGAAGRPVEHGRYASVAKGALAKHLAMVDPTKVADMTGEIGLGQALIATILENQADKLTNDGAEAILTAADKVNRMQDRLIRSRNETALTAAEVKVLQVGILGLIDEFIPDPDKRRAFLARLSKLIPGRPDASS